VDLSLTDLPNEVVRADRLVLRPYRPDDVEAVHRACQDADIQRWTMVPSPYTEDDAVEFVTRTTATARAEGRALTTAVEADGVLVGSAGLHFSRGPLGPAVGYWIAPWARGHGYAGNAASRAAARRAGFLQEGVVRSCLEYRDGTRGDAVLFSRLPSD
jgi:RimJ/RimL family protein N-acetyltransferase